MRLELTDAQATLRGQAEAFVREYVRGAADRWDEEEAVPRAIIERLAGARYLGALAPEGAGGAGLDMVSFGLLNEEIGRGCSSLRSLLTVHSMVIHAVVRWAGRSVRERWLSPLATGAALGAFALSEPQAGSDARAIATTARARGSSFVMDGHKKWTTFGQIADLFCVFATTDGGPAAFLVPRSTPGLTIVPIAGMLGARASMLAELHFEGCEVPGEALVGGLGFGLAGVAMSALEIGRYSVAAGCVGIAQACLDASLSHAGSRRQGGALLREHQLVCQMLSGMETNVSAARLLYLQAGYEKDQRRGSGTLATLKAKYFAARTAMTAAEHAVQIHGALGCSRERPVARYFRDAKIMETIEGSNQIQETLIAGRLFEKGEDDK
jgi:glutaryl-CoA dehydrogenase (non-decarboxylating)